MSVGPINVWLPAVRSGSGADVFVMRLAEGLRAAGHRPCVQWFPLSRELAPWTLARAEPPPETDLIHAGSWQGFAFARPGLPLVVTEHQYVFHPEYLPWRGTARALYHRMLVGPCMARSYARADALVAVSRHTATAMRAMASRPVEVIHNWVDCSRFAPRAEQAPAHERLRLLFVGNRSRWKGADLLPELARQLGRRIELVCLGGLRNRGRSKGHENLTLLDPVPPDRMPAIYRSVDAVLVPTRYEAFGYVTLEAMACGLPVVGFASTGTAEVAVDGLTALLAPPGDIGGLADHIRTLAADPALCRRLGEAGRRRAVEHFDQAAGIAAYLDIYRRVLDGRAIDGR